MNNDQKNFYEHMDELGAGYKDEYKQYVANGVKQNIDICFAYNHGLGGNATRNIEVHKATTKSYD